MPVSFDFQNAGNFTSASGTGPGPLTNTDTDSISNTIGITFTVTTDAAGGSEQVAFGNASFPIFPLLLDDRGGGTAGNDVWTLRFQSTASAVNTVLSANATVPVVLGIGNVTTGAVRIEFLTTGGGTAGATTASNNANESFDFSALNANINGIRFTSATSGEDQLTLTSLSANALNCFCADTRIAVPDGHATVESLRPGDVLRTADGRDTVVRWVGRQQVSTRLMHPARVNPIRISADALAPGLPERDLWLSADHAIAVDGLLVNAGCLVNGRTIAQVPEMPQQGFTYFHIETDAHELILAEGCPAESFLDTSGRAAFVNGAERLAGPPIPEMDLPRIGSARLLPRAIADRIAARAATLLEEAPAAA